MYAIIKYTYIKAIARNQTILHIVLQCNKEDGVEYLLFICGFDGFCSGNLETSLT